MFNILYLYCKSEAEPIRNMIPPPFLGPSGQIFNHPPPPLQGHLSIIWHHDDITWHFQKVSRSALISWQALGGSPFEVWLQVRYGFSPFSSAVFMVGSNFFVNDAWAVWHILVSWLLGYFVLAESSLTSLCVCISPPPSQRLWKCTHIYFSAYSISFLCVFIC